MSSVVIANSDSASVVSGDISRINLTDVPETDDINTVHAEDSIGGEDDPHKHAWDQIVMKDTAQASTGEDFPFFLKDIDISSDILKSDPNGSGSLEYIDNSVGLPQDSSESLESEDTGEYSETPTNGISLNSSLQEDVTQTIRSTVVSDVTKTPTNQDQTVLPPNDAVLPAKDASIHNGAKPINRPTKEDVESEDMKRHATQPNDRVTPLVNNSAAPQTNDKVDILEAHALEMAAQKLNRDKNSPFHREESTGGSSVTITNSVNGSYTSQSRESSAGDGYASNIRVVVRVRPFSLLEKQRGDKQCIKYSGGGGVQVEGPNTQAKGFTFNAVLSQDCTQQQVFQESGIQNLIDKALDGFSCTVFAFGPTGSGKTHTIIGPSERSIEDMFQNQEICGLVVRSFGYLYEATQKRSSVQYIIKASFLEVYNEKVKDLLNPSNAYDSLPVRWSSKKGFYVENLFCVECETSQDLMTLLIEGSNYRQVGVHAINEHSSRSHTIFTVYLEAEDIDTDDDEGFPVIRHGKISFIDLAGSERVKETKTKSDAIAESNNINKSLLALGNCISALGDPKKRGSHIPYRDSKLTKLLADSLGGEGYTLMIACISPASQAYQDTMNALRYANRAKDIKNKPMVKMDPKEQLLHRMRREIKLLRTENNYFRQQQGVPFSESQVILTPNGIDGELTPNSGVLSPAIGSDTLSSLQSSRKNSSNKDLDKDLDITHQTALYALGAKNGLYDILKEYMNENENLKSENMELHRSRAVAHRHQEETSRENERLTRKLDELGRVMLASPISRENIRVWINEGNDGSEIFSPSSAETEPVKTKTSKVKFPPVKKGSYPNYVNVDTSAKVEYVKKEYEAKDQVAELEVKDKVKPSGLSKNKAILTGSDTNEEVEESGKEKGSTSGLSPKNGNSNSNLLKSSNKSKANKSNTKNIAPVGDLEKDVESVSLSKKNRDSIEKMNQEKNDDTENSSGNSTITNAKKEVAKPKKRPWKGRRKPMSVDKAPSSYAAQFAARKGLTQPQQQQHQQQQSMQSERQSIVSDATHMQTYQASQVGSVLISSQPSPYSYIDHMNTPYMSTPMYNYNAGYQYSYMGVAPHMHSLPMNIYENMTSQLQHDLESLNGQLPSQVSYNMNSSNNIGRRHRKLQPPR